MLMSILTDDGEGFSDGVGGPVDPFDGFFFKKNVCCRHKFNVLVSATPNLRLYSNML